MKKLLAAGAMMLAVAGFSGQAKADMVIGVLDLDFSGPQQAAGSIKITIDDGGVAGSVTVEVDATLLDAGAKITEIYLNYDPTKDPSLLVQGAEGGTAPNTSAQTFSTNCCKADGDGDFDIFFEWDPNPPQFLAGQIWTTTLTLAGLTAGDFNFASVNGVPGAGNYCMASHVQSLGANGEDSDHLGATTCTDVTPPPPPGPPPPGPPPPPNVPEPASLLLFGVGLLGLVFLVRRRRLDV